MSYNPNKAVLQIVSQQAGYPITVADARDYLRIDVDTTDNELLDLIKAAVDYAEKNTPGGITLLKKTYDYTLPGFPSSSDTEIRIPVPPLTSITSVKYYDTNNTQQTWSSAQYSVFTPTEGPGFILPAYTYTWPATVDRRDAVVIRYVAGFASIQVIPPRMKQAIRYITVHFFEDRDAFVTGTIISEVGLTIKELLNSSGWGFCAT